MLSNALQCKAEQSCNSAKDKLRVKDGKMGTIEQWNNETGTNKQKVITRAAAGYARQLKIIIYFSPFSLNFLLSNPIFTISPKFLLSNPILDTKLTSNTKFSFNILENYYIELKVNLSLYTRKNLEGKFALISN